jgi:hypothetical protein
LGESNGVSTNTTESIKDGITATAFSDLVRNFLGRHAEPAFVV